MLYGVYFSEKGNTIISDYIHLTEKGAIEELEAKGYKKIGEYFINGNGEIGYVDYKELIK